MYQHTLLHLLLATGVWTIVQGQTPTLSPTIIPPATGTVVPSGKVSNNTAWRYHTCMSDLENEARSLPHVIPSDASASSCLEGCQDRKYAFCGLSYYGECYGGMAISSNSLPQPAANCELPCTDEPDMTCGGVAALDVYMSADVSSLPELENKNPTIAGWVYSACQSDLFNNSRVLDQYIRTSPVTIETCLTGCTAAGAKACGLQYYGECWYTTTALSSTSTVLSASRCEFPCLDAPNTWCGGHEAVSLYLPPGGRPNAVSNSTGTSGATPPSKSSSNRSYASWAPTILLLIVITAQM